MSYEMQVTCSMCPVQIEGIIGNRRWYFRARWDNWTFQVGDFGNMDLFAAVEAEEFMSGKLADAGSMSIDLAKDICKCALDLWNHHIEVWRKKAEDNNQSKT